MRIDMVKLGENIKTRRMAIGWTQNMLADAMGVSQPQISHWESGKGEDISILTYFKLAAFLTYEDGLIESEVLEDVMKREICYGVVRENDTNGQTTFYQTLEAANADAEYFWKQLTPAEKKRTLIWVFGAWDDDPWNENFYHVSDEMFSSEYESGYVK